MWARLKDRYTELSPDKKRQVTIGVAAAGVLVVALWSYLGSKDEPGQGTAAPQGEVSTYRLETKILDKKYHEDRAAELKKATLMYGEIMREMGELRGLVEEEGRRTKELRGKTGSVAEIGPQPSSGLGRPFPRAYQPYEEDRVPAEGAAGRILRDSAAVDPATQRPPEVVGGIQMVSLENVAGDEGDKKKDGAVETVYLPPSFVAAHLLSGVDAPVLKEGTSNPMPMLLRLKDLAVLPNRVKADLKGCFVIAGGTGSLATERVDARLITLSCVSKGGDSVIDSPVKGYLVDADGKQGLQGKVVAKMGSMLARSMVAGILSGAGDYLESTTTTTMVSPLGVTETSKFEPDAMARGAIGKGLSQATRQLQDFYMDLARETFPVIEIGSGRDVTVVVSEGVEMQIKPYVGVKDCEDCRPTVLTR